MAIALVSKPGITNASVKSIPVSWSPAWFRNFVITLLQGADVRNAVGKNGITVSGNIASPYATISIASSGPIVTSGPVTIGPPPAGSIALAVIGNGVQNAVGITGNGSISPLVLQGDNAAGYGIIFQGGVTGAIEYGGIGPGSRNVTGAPLNSMCVWAADNGPVILGAFNGSYIALETDATGTTASITIFQNTAALPCLKVDQTSTNTAGAIQINNTTTSVVIGGIGGGGLITGQGVNDLGLYSSTAIDFSANNGASVQMSLSSAGLLTVPGGTTLLATYATLTAGATGNAPTLTAGPVTGNPTKWIAINDNGTVRHIPAW